MLFCESFYSASLSANPSSIIVEGALNATTAYYVRITDKFGNRYTQQIATGSDGSLTIPVNTTYPTGFFTAYSGFFKMEASLALTPFAPANFTFNTKTYPCIQLSFQNDNQQVNTIQ